ncbi:conserved hypothetical protein [Candidatus Terasakiella magnetica]|nr:conserved hypothetical protein [Candidatus Terasakiella magnetica]
MVEDNFIRRYIAKILSPAAIAVLTVLEPLISIRLGVLMSERIGHLAINTEIYARRRNAQPRPPLTVFVCHEVANDTLLSMWKQHFVILRSYFLTSLFMAMRPTFKNSRFFADIDVYSDEHDEISDLPPVCALIESEEREGQKRLREMGIEDGAPWICFHTRDSAHLGWRPSEARTIRNGSIDNYLEAARWIAAQGGYAIRMGSMIEKPLPPGLDSRIIDYATCFRSDFMDIYLAARCKFFLGSTAGLVCVSYMFGVPVAGGNYVPLCQPGWGRSTLYTPKLLRRISDGSPVKYGDAACQGVFDGARTSPWRADRVELYDALDLEYVENDATDILGLCQDMWDQVHNTPPPQGAAEIQAAYHRLHTDLHASTNAGRLSPRFALRHKDLILE